MVDSFSKWCEVVVIRTVTSKCTIDICRNIFSKYGLPNQIATDNGPQFTSEEFKSFCGLNGINHFFSAPYHQSSNGQAERFEQTVKKGLKLNDIEKGEAQKKLDNYLFAYRITPSCVTNKTPAELFLGRKIKSRLSLMKPSLECFQENFIKKVSREFEIGDIVFIRRYESQDKWIAGIILERVGKCVYAIKIDGKVYRRHIDQILRNNIVFPSEEYMDYEFNRNVDRPHVETIVDPTNRSEDQMSRKYPRRI